MAPPLQYWRQVALLFVILWSAPGTSQTRQADATVAGDVELTATFEHIGVRWAIDGDEDRDGDVALRYRRSGDEQWREGLPLTRSHVSLVGEGGDRPDNRWAGSVFWLVPGKTYELELRLNDPDGGSVTRVVAGTTRTPLAPALDARHRYVVPGEGGGDGSRDAPFRGLQAAADGAEPGDYFHVAPGTYRPFQLLVSGEPSRPIVFRGPDDGTAAVDGSGTDRGIITLGDYDRTISQVMLENLSVFDGRWGIDAQHSSDISVRYVTMRSVDYGYLNRRGEAREGNQTICDSVFQGRTPWPGEGIPSERAIDLRGFGNVVCANSISGFGDGVSMQPFTGPSWGNDAYSNDIEQIVDDPIEIDYNQANVRVWANRVTNARMGVSLAPIYGGPAYVFRNTFVNLDYSAYKMNREPAGLVVLHNTSLKLGNGTSSPRHWQNTWLRNNFIFGTRYVFEEYGLAEGSIDDWDYDALARDPECGGDSPPCFKWDNTRYAELDDLALGAGIEASGMVGHHTDLVRVRLPGSYQTPVAPDTYDLRLVEGAPEADSGAVLANVNDPWVTDGHPDIGAHERGSAAMRYGPRPLGAPITYLDYAATAGTPGATATAGATVGTPTETAGQPSATAGATSATATVALRTGTPAETVPTGVSGTPTRTPSAPEFGVYLPIAFTD